MDLVSLIVLADGDDAELIRTLDSLLMQDYPQLEIVAAGRLENTSTAASLFERYPDVQNLRYLALPAASRPGVCLNAAAQLAQGDYAAFLRAGATASPGWVSASVRALKQSPGAVWCYAAASVRGSGVQLPPPQWPDFKKTGRIFSDIITASSVSLQSVVMTQEQLYVLDGFDEDLSDLVEDEFLLRLALSAPAIHLKTPMLELAPADRTSPGALVSRCYFMTAFIAALGQQGLKADVMQSLLRDIDDADAWENMRLYLDILDEDPEYQACMRDYQDKKYPPRTLVLADTPNVAGVTNCVGCGSCHAACPEKAISMVYDDEGFLVPRVDESLCTRCGLCLAVCPTQQQLPAQPVPRTSLALQAADDVRMKASSGGVFPVLARYVLDQGGYVAGAVYDKNFIVRHIVSSDPKEVRAMQTSKYVQSNTAAVYPQVKKLLEDGKTVLFTGCACQVAGLRAFLQKPYDGLYTMDVACHGVPSVKVYESYLRELQRQGGRLAEVNFRKKEVFGWNPNLYVRFANGKAYQPKGLDLYMACFLSNWILRESCYACEFKGMKYSDLTAADFWGIQYLDQTFEDGKGSSYLTVNTEKGEQLLACVADSFVKTAQIDRAENERILPANICLVRSVERPAFRDAFFAQWKKDPSSLNNAVVRAFQSLHFDIGLILHWSVNFGNAMTNYALYTYLSKKWKVLAVDNCSTLRPQGVFAEFAKKHYLCSSGYYPRNALARIEQSCDTLMVGSDQVWNDYFNHQFKSGDYYYLDFAGNRVRKVAYGASFGTKGAEPPAEGYAKYFQRFSSIGVREKFGVDVCRDLYGVQAEHVLDPVFLLDAPDYEKLAAESRLEINEPFILAYILNPNEDKRRACLRVQEQLGGDIRIISICEPAPASIDICRHGLDFAWVQSRPTIEDFLYLYKNCRYVITDSFHGTCFSLIFEKKFMSFVNRQPDRFSVFELFGDADAHIGKALTEPFFKACMQSPDFDRIRADIRREQEHSRTWLENALK